MPFSPFSGWLSTCEKTGQGQVQWGWNLFRNLTHIVVYFSVDIYNLFQTGVWVDQHKQQRKVCGKNVETSEEKENQARDQNLGKSERRNKCDLAPWGCQGPKFCLQNYVKTLSDCYSSGPSKSYSSIDFWTCQQHRLQAALSGFSAAQKVLVWSEYYVMFW